MGQGYVLQCKICRYKFETNLGVGFLLPSVTKETIEKMKSGEYGEKAEEFFRNHPDGTVDCCEVLYQCEKCGALKTEMDLTMYARKEGSADPDVILPDSDSYDKAEEFEHKCDKCGKPMKEVDIDSVFEGKLRCPRCRGRMEIKDIICWD